MLNRVSDKPKTQTNCYACITTWWLDSGQRIWVRHGGKWTIVNQRITIAIVRRLDYGWWIKRELARNRAGRFRNESAVDDARPYNYQIKHCLRHLYNWWSRRQSNELKFRCTHNSAWIESRSNKRIAQWRRYYCIRTFEEGWTTSRIDYIWR